MSDLIKDIEEAENALKKIDEFIRAQVPICLADRGRNLMPPIQATLQRAREALTSPDWDVPKTICLLEEGNDIAEWSWCEDPDPDGEERRVFEYRLVDEWVNVDEDDNEEDTDKP